MLRPSITLQNSSAHVYDRITAVLPGINIKKGNTNPRKLSNASLLGYKSTSPPLIPTDVTVKSPKRQESEDSQASLTSGISMTSNTDKYNLASPDARKTSKSPAEWRNKSIREFYKKEEDTTSASGTQIHCRRKIVDIPRPAEIRGKSHRK